jgi:hypothetical protein
MDSQVPMISVYSPVAQLISTNTLSSPFSFFLASTGAKYSFAISNSLSAPGNPAAAKPCLHPRSYANETEGEVNKSLMGIYSTFSELVTLAMMDRNGGGVSERRDARIGDLDTDDFSLLSDSRSEDEDVDDDAGSNKLM